MFYLLFILAGVALFLSEPSQEISISIAPALIFAGISAASAATNVLRSFKGLPEFRLTEEDVNRQINQAMNRALAEVASGTRRRLIGSGQGGSGSINAAIQDAQSRVRSMFEGERTKALNLLKQAQSGRDVQSANQLTNVLGGLTDIGFSAFQLFNTQDSSQQQGFPGQAQLEEFVNLLPLGRQNAANFSGSPIQPLPPRAPHAGVNIAPPGLDLGQ